MAPCSRIMGAPIAYLRAAGLWAGWIAGEVFRRRSKVVTRCRCYRCLAPRTLGTSAGLPDNYPARCGVRRDRHGRVGRKWCGRPGRWRCCAGEAAGGDGQDAVDSDGAGRGAAGPALMRVELRFLAKERIRAGEG